MTEVAQAVNEPRTPRLLASGKLVDERLVLCYFVASLILVVGAMLAGFFYSLQFLQVYPFPGIEPLSPGRWRMVHTSVVVYGFIANAFLGGLHWVVPRLTLHTVLSRRLSWLIFFAWQGVVIAMVVGLVLGHAQAVEWGETPVCIDSIVLVGLFMMAVNLLMPIFTTTGPLFVSLWYFIAGLMGAILAYGVGNFAPESSDAGGIAGMFIHEPVGLFITPIGWGLMYYFVPIILNAPIWSHRLALMGFWGLTFFYPISAVLHLLRGSTSTLPAYEVAISTAIVGLVVMTVMVNFFATVRLRRMSFPVRWFYLGMVFYLAAFAQYAVQMATSVEQLVPLTDWVVGHAHLVLFGVFGFWVMGMMTHLFPRLLGADEWYSPQWNAWHFWFSGIGMLVMFVDLLTAGIVQGFLWNQLAPWEESVTASTPFWLIRTASGVAIIVGQFFFVFNILMTVIHKRSVPVTTGTVAGSIDASAEPAMRASNKSVFVFAGLGSFFLALAFMVLVPRDSSQQSVNRLAREGIVHEFVELAERFPEPFSRHFPAGVTYDSFAEALTVGRRVYVVEGCWHCHTQQVRPESQDTRRWGSPARVSEHDLAIEQPLFVGTRRVGPDLSREAARRSNDWHYAHFFTPTSVSPTSVMPVYTWFFDDDRNPNKKGLSIVAYMQWLGSRLPEYPYYQGEGPPGSTTNEVQPTGLASTSEPIALFSIGGYLLIVVGIICLFVWAVANGMCCDVERPKYTMLESDALCMTRTYRDE